MAKSKKPIFTVGFALPGDDFDYIDFYSDQTLLDADIVLFEPTLGHSPFYCPSSHNGVDILSHENGARVHATLNHWRSEILSALEAGKMLVIYATKEVWYYRYTGTQAFSGTGRNRVTTNHVAPISSYDAIPGLKRVVAKSGNEVALTKQASCLASYWREFSAFSSYQVELEGSEFTPLLTVGDRRVVGAISHGNAGHLLYLPPLRWNEDEFETTETDDGEEIEYWTEEGLSFGAKLASTLRAIAKSLNTGEQTPPPAWAQAPVYQTNMETLLETKLNDVGKTIEVLESQRAELERELTHAGTLRALLYEQGRPLELAILQAMTLLGFKAENFADGKSEFDVVLECPDGRCIGEAEGKDNKAINIDKFSQLERNLQEDFARDNVIEFAKGILFGNAQRLLPLDQRGEFFTDKCIAASKRVGAALVRTPDLFEPAKYMQNVPTDNTYAELCRKAIFATAGDIVAFPPPPNQ